MKRVALGCAVALGLIVGGATSVQAGEYNGKGGFVPGASMAHSACAYSGRDVPDDVEDNPPGFEDDELTSLRNFTQSYGVFVSLGLKSLVPSPGLACRGNAVHEE